MRACGCGCCSPPSRCSPACSTRCCCRRRAGSASELHVATAGTQADQVRPNAAPWVALPEAPALPGVTRMPDLATALRRAPGTTALVVHGSGLPARDRDTLRIPVRLALTLAPAGLVAVSTPPPVAPGERIAISARVQGLPGARVELLDPAGQVVDTAAADARGQVQLRGLARIRAGGVRAAPARCRRRRTRPRDGAGADRRSAVRTRAGAGRRAAAGTEIPAPLGQRCRHAGAQPDRRRPRRATGRGRCTGCRQPGCAGPAGHRPAPPGRPGQRTAPGRARCDRPRPGRAGAHRRPRGCGRPRRARRAGPGRDRRQQQRRSRRAAGAGSARRH